MGKDATQIAKWFGNNLWYKEVNEDGTDLSSPDTFKNIGHLVDGKLVREPSYETVKADHGQVVVELLDEDTPTISGNLLQSDKSILDFLGEGCRGKFYRIVLDLGRVGGKRQALICGVAQFTSKVELSANSRRPPYEIKVRRNENAITETASGNLDALVAQITSNITIGAEQYYYIFEEA